jgi:hypothetical protein
MELMGGFCCSNRARIEVRTGIDTEVLTFSKI